MTDKITPPHVGYEPDSWVCPLEENFRFILPVALRQKLGTELVITTGVKFQWLLFSASDWKVFSSALIEKHSSKTHDEAPSVSGVAKTITPKKSIILRRVIAPAQQCRLDAQGGLVLPEIFRFGMQKEPDESPAGALGEALQRGSVKLHLSLKDDHLCIDPIF